MRNAIEMFSTFIDSGTYALFYFNGHAIGHGNDVYLVAKDTDLNPEISLRDNLMWHGEVETRLDKCRCVCAVLLTPISIEIYRSIDM